MAKRTVDPAEFALHYPPGTAEKCYEAALVIQRECEITTQIRTHRESLSSGTSGSSTTSSFHEERFFQQQQHAAQPPSWADVGVEEQQQPPRGYGHFPEQCQPFYQPSQFYPYHEQPMHHQMARPEQHFLMQQQQQPPAPDVFSSMGHWQCEKPKGRYAQFQSRPQYQPPRGADVFQDVGVWDNSLPQQQQQQQKIVPMPVDPYAPTPPPTFQPYPPMSSPSTSSSSGAPEEKNSWKSFDFLLSQMPSTSSNLQ